jgi:beta-glucosidase
VSEHPFQNPELPTEDRIDSLLGLMTLAEKIECLSTNPSVPRLGVEGSGHVEGLHGLALGGPGRWGRDDPVPTTTFPQAIGLAQTWDPDVLHRVAEIESIEARHAFHCLGRGGLVVRAPNADLGRDPRWGRTEECYGEDPFLTATLAVAFVRGLQGDHPRYWRTAALLKHFFANSNEDEREHSSSDFDECQFREYYACPFERAIREGGSRAFMAAYNAHLGIPCAVHPILKEITVAEWGQDGIICTDGGGFKLLVTAHRHYPDLYQAAAATLRAGITQYLDDFRESVCGAFDRGLITERDIDAALRGNFRVMIRLGLLDPPERVPYARPGPESPPPWESEAHRVAVREVTRRSIVLLENSAGLLPLDADTLESIAVIGPLADRVLTDWYSGTPPYTVSPVEGIRARVGPRTTVRLCANNDVSDAIRIAKQSEVCLVCVGNHPTGDGPWAVVTRKSYGREAVDRQSIELEDESLVRRVLAANPRTILLLVSSFPYAINWSKENVPAIVQVTHNSQELGTGLADVLFGDENPAGRLVQTWPRSIEDLPPRLDYDITHGRGYQYSAAEPLYPFGYGLSFTTFEYSALRCSADGGSVTVHVDVENTGKRAGDEVVQLYVRRPGSPRQQLAGFRRVAVGAGERRTVHLELGQAELAHWDPEQRRFVVEPGEVEIRVGASSADIRLATTIRVG